MNTFNQISDIIKKGKNEFLLQAVCKCIPNLARYFPEKAKSIIKENMVFITETGTNEREISTAVYVTVGLCKSLGMKYIKSPEANILQILQKKCFDGKKIDPLRKRAGLWFLDTMSFSMGKAFEVYLNEMLPCVLSAVSDNRDAVREDAQTTLKMIMSNLSNYAIKQALPHFLDELQNDNWRSKLATIEALGNMAYCAPKQISAFLPEIVKHLRNVLNDTHQAVHNGAIQAIEKIGSVIKCPEISDMLKAIISALANTNLHLNYALRLMLETQFVHAIDAPSLSLLVPLLDAGLTMHDN